ncbi:MAG: hypothetical protein ACXWF8_14635 [Methylobacter sp.]
MREATHNQTARLFTKKLYIGAISTNERTKMKHKLDVSQNQLSHKMAHPVLDAAIATCWPAICFKADKER